jgi:ribosomal protein L11 methyltransferase
MYLWQRLAPLDWWSANEEEVRGKGGTELAIIERPGRKRLTLEISCRTQARAIALRRRFGGRVTKLKRDWVKRFTRPQKSPPLNFGKRLVVTNADGASASRVQAASASSRRQGRSHIVIPAGAAFGTGQHSTTAMSLRLLERLTRGWNSGWSMLDLGTGSGIFALAAKRFGAGHVTAIDIDPVAISTAKENARLNRITGVKFQVADALKLRPLAGVNVVTANLFSELLIQVLPRVRGAQWLILSGVMRDQERDVACELKRNRIDIVTIRRRGKWIALLVSACSRNGGPQSAGQGKIRRLGRRR